MTAPTFRILPASTGSVVQCGCGWYVPVYDADPAVLHERHVLVDHDEAAQTRAERPDATEDTRQVAYASQIDAGRARNGMPTGPGEPQ